MSEIELTIEQQIEQTWKEHEDQMIAVYVPEADQMSREEALDLAYERNLNAVTELESDCSVSRGGSDTKVSKEDNSRVTEILHIFGCDY